MISIIQWKTTVKKNESTFTFLDFEESNISDDLLSEGETGRKEIKKSTCSDLMANSPLLRKKAKKSHYMTPNKELEPKFVYESDELSANLNKSLNKERNEESR